VHAEKVKIPINIFLRVQVRYICSVSRYPSLHSNTELERYKQGLTPFTLPYSKRTAKENTKCRYPSFQENIRVKNSKKWVGMKGKYCPMYSAVHCKKITEFLYFFTKTFRKGKTPLLAR